MDNGGGRLRKIGSVSNSNGDIRAPSFTVVVSDRERLVASPIATVT